jgi:hypothetical protein
MSTISNLYLPQLHNGENVAFHHDTLAQLDHADPVKLGVGEQVTEYRSAFNELKTTFDVFSGSHLSPELTKKDKRRDNAYSAFKAYVKVYANDEDEAAAAAAERLLSVIRKSAQEVGDPLLLGLTKESSAISSLLRNLEPLAADVNRIGAAGRLQQLADANQAYIDLQFERYIEQGNLHSGDVKAARGVADAAYKKIVERINAQIILNGDAAFESYVNAQNEIIEKYKNIVAQRNGLAKKTED